MTAIVAEDVSRAYGDTVAVDGVSLSVEEGEVFGLVGPNGAGKTTLVRALVGTTDAEGRVELFGEDPRAVARERVGLLPQNFDPPARLTARELLAYYASLYDDRRPVEAVLEDVGMAGDADTYYENLSGGQQRRTCVATALVNDPDLLVLDEPTTGIDPAGRRQLWDLLSARAEAGATVLVTTHYMEEAQRLADRVGLMTDGSLLAVDTPERLVAEHGGDSLLRVRLTSGGGGGGSGSDGGGTAATPDAAEMPGLPELGYPVERRDGRLTVRGVPPEEVGTVADRLSGAGVRYDSLTWTEPDLEDVYLELTGQRVVEGEAVAEEAVA
ncbi:ABC transporter ATP-binding protein [Salinirussus salinus]|jgi:ABC-2 type transport system ATP-binding protein|uniref:ABC transporter ATP-binding protein n=1 Tax=Salinirussus salinus TaxID=1198300 RepID=UPI00135C403B|nr:ABC transporter ATP-binding protein [Salinirussus salinus]